jgi:rhomboid family GlyGly-CTERM serine protease
MPPVRPAWSRHSWPWRSALLGLAAAGAYLAWGSAPEAWVFDRAAIAQGEWWRLLTGHWVHSDPAHAAWDISMLLVLGAAFEPRLGWRLPLVLLASSVGVDAWLWWGASSLHYYCGLSGILHGLLGCGLWVLWRDQRHPLIAITAAGVVAKTVIENGSGEMVLTQTAWPGVPMAHLVGLCCGILLAGLFCMRERRLRCPVQRHRPVITARAAQISGAGRPASARLGQ